MAEPSNQPNTPIAHDLAGTTVGRFMIRNRLGAGGMGQVYAAEDTILKRRIAIKRMTPRLRSDPADLKRFLKEAQRASALNHPNIAAIYDVLENVGEVLLVMEYVEGTTLRRRFAETISTDPTFTRGDFGRIQSHANVDEKRDRSEPRHETDQQQGSANNLDDTYKGSHDLRPRDADLYKATDSKRVRI